MRSWCLGLLLVEALVLGGCRRHRAAPRCVQTVARADAGPARTPCEILRAENARTLELVPTDVRPTIEHVGWCETTSNGAHTWALIAERASQQEGTLRLRVALVHRGADGAEARAYPGAPSLEPSDATASVYNWERVQGDTSVSFQAPTQFDYNADGVPEVALIVRRYVEEDADYERGKLWTFTDGVVALYERAESLSFVQVRDVDSDGRPDLLSHGRYETNFDSCGSGFAYRVYGPLFAFHSLNNGEFSNNDSAAQAFLRTECPERPTTVATRTEDGSRVDERGIARKIACARVWGGTPAELRPLIQQACPASRNDPPCDTCDSIERMFQWSSIQPNLTLSTPDAGAPVAPAAPAVPAR